MLQTDDRPARNAFARRARLVVPSGLLVDDATRDRLAQQLERAPGTVAGVAAKLGPLAPGSSYRVHAEWMSLSPLDVAAAAPSDAVHGAVLLRDGVDYRVDNMRIDVGGASLLVDPGAHVHDPRAPAGGLATAEAHGRSPFPRRPIVVFLGTDRDEHVAEWARALVNRLIPRDVEGRLALPVVAEGLHLTRPAAPTEESIHALEPDAIVALDVAALRRAHEWSGENRSTVVIELDRSLTATSELVSWQVGHASGRLRARIGPRIDAPALGALVRRLGAGPQPLPPRDRPTPAPLRARVADHAPSRTCAFVTGDLEAAAVARLAGFGDHMRAAGMAVAQTRIDEELRSGIVDASLVILSGQELGAAATELVAARHERKLPTVLDLGPRDVRVADDGAPELTDAAAALATMCGRATSFGGALHDAARRIGIRALIVPTMLTRRRSAELRAARNSFDPSALVIGWTGGAPGRASEYDEAAAVGLAKVVADHRDARVVRAVDGDEYPADDMGAWTVHLFTPAAIGGELAGDVLPFTEAGHAGVPTVLPAFARAAIDGFVAAPLVVDEPEEPEQWSAALHHVLESLPRRAQLAGEARRRADAVDAAATSKAVVNRLVGWARFDPESER